MKTYIDNLLWWLKATNDQVFDRFSGEYPDAIQRGKSDQRFLYVPGKRKNRVLLIAHADTVWDKEDEPRRPVILKGIINSASDTVGIGADDRAGCSILWELRELGHSLLILNGEEEGGIASTWLKTASINRKLYNEINKTHCFAIEFDRRNGHDFKCYEVGTDEFREYCHKMTGYTEPNRTSYTDICQICRDICGVNLSVGYRNEHYPEEQLVIKDYLRTLSIARKWLRRKNVPLFMLSR